MPKQCKALIVFGYPTESWKVSRPHEYRESRWRSRSFLVRTFFFQGSLGVRHSDGRSLLLLFSAGAAAEHCFVSAVSPFEAVPDPEMQHLTLPRSLLSLSLCLDRAVGPQHDTAGVYHFTPLNRRRSERTRSGREREQNCCCCCYSSPTRSAFRIITARAPSSVTFSREGLEAAAVGEGGREERIHGTVTTNLGDGLDGFCVLSSGRTGEGEREGGRPILRLSTCLARFPFENGAIAPFIQFAASPPRH